jgi:hypothetical protein
MSGTRARSTERNHVQTAALAVGVVFLLVSLLGSVPGATSNDGRLSFAGHHSEAMLVGVFQVSVLHDVVHLLFGVACIAMAKTRDGARGATCFGAASCTSPCGSTAS